MNSVKEFFLGLFQTNLWPPRWHCGEWSSFLGWLYIISDLSIWASYFLIPVIIINYFSKKKTQLKFQRIYTLFASFILLCGTTHFIDAVMFWEPMYRFNALVRFITAAVSISTVYYLFKILPVAFAQKTSSELEKEINNRKEVELKLAEANKKLLDANQDLESFAYIASHDLKEPLRKIQTFCGLLDKNHSFDENAKKYIDKIHSSASRLNAMIGEVLSLSTLPEQIKMEVCDPNKAINQALKDIEMKVNEKDALIHVGVLPKIIANSGYLSQVFSNLLNNAIKFSIERPQIEIYGKQVADRVLLYVCDNGIGMEPEYAEKIFKPFYRLNGKKEYEGFGIGLAICKKIIDLHKGNITVESMPGKGTTFLLNFPSAS